MGKRREGKSRGRRLTNNNMKPLNNEYACHLLFTTPCFPLEVSLLLLKLGNLNHWSDKNLGDCPISFAVPLRLVSFPITGSISGLC